MSKRLSILAACLAALTLSCGSPKKASTPLTRDFPMAEIPMMITTTPERMIWLSQFFWNPFTATDSLYFCDSLTVNGVTLENLEKQMGIFASLLQQVPLADGKHAMTRFWERLDAFQRTYPQGNVLPQTVALASRYFYDPNSPVRSEDLYLPFVSALATSDLIDPAYRMGYEWDARMCALNSIGTSAADFAFIDSDGHRRTLYGIKARRVLLIFGNPDCHACKELMEQMERYPEIGDMIDGGDLQVVDIYIDQEIELWKQQKDSYPAKWINGYDPSYTIRQDLVYNVRAIPSLYLLDQDKKVLLKDALPEQVLGALLRN